MDRVQQPGPLFTVNWLTDAGPTPIPEKLDSDRDLLAALENAATDRGDRSFHQDTRIWAWQGNGWRLRDVFYFVVDVDGDQTEKAVEWLLKRGYRDEEDPNGWVYVFVLENGTQHTLHSLRPMAQQTVVNFPGSTWLIAEKWAINLSRVVSYTTLYGKLSVLHEHWAKPPQA